MFELFRNVLCLSAVGSGAVLILMITRPIIVKRITARMHYNICLAAMLFMLVPFWSMLPAAGSAPQTNGSGSAAQEATGQDAQSEPLPETVIIDEVPMEYREIEFAGSRSVRIYDLAAYIWAAGAAVFMGAAAVSYTAFLVKRKRGSAELVSYGPLEEIKGKMGIKRNIRIRVSDKTVSPMLVGILFPVIYIPREMPDRERLMMVLKHELTHYKSGDLLFKWAALFVNALHWFNPFAYFLSANINRACEVACDMAVVKDMSEAEKRTYMETILELAEG